MPEKQPFDHRRHLLGQNNAGESKNGGGEATMDDETLARILQDEILEEERRRDPFGGDEGGRTSFSVPVANPYPPNPHPPDTTGDMQLLMTLQREEMNALRDNRQVDDMELARRMQHEEALGQMQSDYQDQLKYARQIQERAYRKSAAQDMLDSGGGYPPPYDAQQRNSGNPPYDTQQHNNGNMGSSSHGTDHDSDLDLARRMQELEQMGMGRMNSDRNIGKSNHREASPTSARSRQEAEDTRLARMMQDTGQSLRNIHAGSSSPPKAPALAQQLAPLAEPPHPIGQITIPSPPPDNDWDPDPPPAPGNRSPIFNRPAARGRSSTSPKPPSQKKTLGVAIPGDRMDDPLNVDFGPDNGSSKDRKKNFGGLFSRTTKDKGDRGSTPPRPKKTLSPVPRPKKPSTPASIPTPIPPRPQSSNGPLPYSSVGSHQVNVPVAGIAIQKKKMLALPRKNPSVCSSCQKPATSFLIALDKKYHSECFKCVGCYQVIDSTCPFAFMTDESSNKHPLHRSCYAELYGVKCAVCKQSIPAGPDGKVSFVKHPFFDKEQMCPRHAKNPGRRCTGCHRFEPDGEPFAELNDSGRCVCDSCCRSVVVDSEDAQPLWDGVIEFFENVLNLPIWKDLRKVPILVVGYEALNNQMISTGATHGGSSQIMTRGLCLTEHQSGRKFKLAKLKYNKNNASFVSGDVEARGYTFFQVPDASKVNPDSSVTAILCLSGLPRDLTASVLAHEATHAWVKLHPRFDISYPIPPQVEEGCAQLIAMLFLTEGMMPASTETYGDSGPSDAKLRQYFKFSIETEDNEIYGEGYRKAATAYANIGIEALLSHIVLYQDFPKT